ncbi:hypothetical protein BJ170DRAFT_183488 [Xylariales sp. AK1849]|nr:hypothetical protein BJ170DRAFT_183488 [Xylariales sp. AK1849]
MDGIRGSSPTKNSGGNDSPEQLLDAFRAAALSVTKLYKTSATAQTKARSDGYQDCLDDLLAFLDKQHIGLSDGEGWQIRRWATERLDGRDGVANTIESEDEVEKNEPASSPELHRSNSNPVLSTARNEPETTTDSAPPPTAQQQSDVTSSTQAPQIVVPTQDNFTFQSPMTFPPDSDFNMSNLDLSDSRNNPTTSSSTQHHATSHPLRVRNSRGVQRPRVSSHLSRGAGSKRKINIAEIFDLGSLGGKDVFGGSGGGKRSRHA